MTTSSTSGSEPGSDPAFADAGSTTTSRAHDPWVRPRQLAYGPIGLLAFGVAVFGLAFLAVALAPADNRVAAWWPAAGLSVAAVAWAPPRRRWAVVLTIAVFSGAANGLGGRPPEVAAGFGISNAAEAFVVGWWLVRGGRTPRLVTMEDLARLVTATVLGTLVMGLGAGLTVALGLGGDFVTTARTVVASHGAAILVMTPLAMRLQGRQPHGRGPEGAVQFATALGVTAVVFAPGQSLPMTFVPIPVLVWGALRLGPRTVAFQVLVTAVLISVLTRLGGGPFAAVLGQGTTHATSLVQAYLVVVALIMLPLAVSVAQRKAALERVVASERLFRQSFSEAMLGMLLLRRCTAGHDAVVERLGDGADAGHHARGRLGPAEEHASGGLDIVQLNEVATRILTRPEADLVGASFTARLEPQDRAVLADAVAAMVGRGSPGWHGEVAMRSREGLRWVEVALSPLSAAAGDGMFVAQMVDVTARRAAEERLTALALEDSLTGLVNRVLLRERLEEALQGEGASGTAVLFCDLDDFKLVNDSGGHTQGDVVLVEVAGRIRGLVDEGDLAARLGGDEFVVLRPSGATPEGVEMLAAKLLAALAAPVVVGGQTFTLGVSIGIAWGTPGITADDLLRDADAAMYAAKGEGKRRAVVFSDDHRAHAVRAVRVESELRRALADHELEVYLQPVVDLVDGSWVAAEALVRWNHPRRGVLAPAEWLDIAELSGLMPEIGRWVLDRSCALAMSWPSVGGASPPAVHVNVSARQLDVPGFSAEVHRALHDSGLPPGRLVLEFTETQLDNVSDALLADLAALREAGIGLAADDFGTGYSPLTRIIELPLTMLKVDRLFVAGMLEDVRSQAIVTTLVRLSESLGLALVAEGVETEAQAQALRLLGCPTGQGYLWSRAVPAEDFLALLTAGQRREEPAVVDIAAARGEDRDADAAARAAAERRAARG